MLCLYLPFAIHIIAETKGNDHTKHMELAARWYVFIFLNHYGIEKISGGQFYLEGHLPAQVAEKTLVEVSNFELAWSFMGYSFYYILFFGLLKMIGGRCLLWNKTRLIGVENHLTIMTNIIVFEIIFLDKYGL